MANVVYNNFKGEVMKGTFNLHTGGNTVKIALLNSTYSVDVDAHTQWCHVKDKEVSGTGYTAGGKTLANQVVSVDNTDNKGVFDADDVTWSSATITARYAVIYKYIDNAGSPADTSPLICLIDFAADQTSTNGDFTITFDAEGILNLG